ncbi:hypothetical protein K227x_04700 [Rubripirellula lacrimiformis]|uniref:Zeta toxin n=1 Tax=Rubripirellula lacrimiformis TaxID=1930273 RepID=A0A517N4P5_9BACT|nr:bifunctional aminoglycoside phosphotransferase/ATP-binding protein [Rubripirellula lacrimiformis]QDT02099.1 hypothetical protein K227x_04700 [Rubripirellula lacrimiformis]
MKTQTDDSITTNALIAALRNPAAYPHDVGGDVVVHETHISVVFLAGQYAYKIKKPIKTNFLDYSTLHQRKHFCEEEVRLDRRYAQDLYLGVVPIHRVGGTFAIGGEGDAVEYAVKMRRFPAGDLLSERIDSGRLTTAEVFQLAQVIAKFHRDASVCGDAVASQWPDFIVKNVHQIIATLETTADSKTKATLKGLHTWSNDFFARHLQELTDRVDGGFIRECHGDLHLDNVVLWQNSLVPFDGIEFNDQLRWIDVLSDATFLAMDLAARGHLDLSRSFLNAYLEQTGDYGSPNLLRLFLFYRSLVRALAASMRSDADDLSDHVDLAYRFTLREAPRLWITHGVSGSGKTTLSEFVVQRHDAFRLRSDVERKRLFGLSPTERPSAELATTMYSDDANARTYARLIDLTGPILQAGYSVIIDATFLKQADRNRFHDLARRQGVDFAILDCRSDRRTLFQRVADRSARGDDASDADPSVLQYQLSHQQPLSDSEREHVIEIPQSNQIADQL